MKHDKSPGHDGFPSEFYKYLWNVIGPFFNDALKDTYIWKKTDDTHAAAISNIISVLLPLYISAICVYLYTICKNYLSN